MTNIEEKRKLIIKPVNLKKFPNTLWWWLPSFSEERIERHPISRLGVYAGV